MPPEAALSTSAPHRLTLPAPWCWPAAALTVAWGVLFVVFARDWATMADQWWNSSTYTHILLIPPIIAWLVWQRRTELAQVQPHGWWPGIALFGGAMLFWLIGAFAGLNILRQVGVILAFASATLALLGPRTGWVLAFPLFYMLFLVPFGDELVPPLQLVTARLTIGLVHLSHIPASVDGVFISTPAGLFEVAEACSGIKFLIAMIAFGVLAGHVCFRSWRRRAGFLAVCIAVPILANAVRAWGTIFAAQYVGSAVAGGFDHIVYGWVFFALVIALVIALGWGFFDRDAGAPLVNLVCIENSPLLGRLARYRIGLSGAMLAMAVMIAGVGVWTQAADRLNAALPAHIALPEVPGWHRIDYRPAVWWQPRATGANHRLLGRYADDSGHQVDVFFALYSGQSDGRKAGGFGEGALTPDTSWEWLAPGPALADAKSDRLLADGRIERLAETRYRSGRLLTGSDARLRMETLRSRLLLHTEPTMLLILSAENAGQDRPGEALNAFRRSIGPIDGWMDRMASGS